jgi:hypothetical protein
VKETLKCILGGLVVLAVVHAVAAGGGGTATPVAPRAASADTVVAASASAATPVVPGGLKRCDGGVSARRGTTTCSVAQDVFWSYYEASGGDEVVAHDPTTGIAYRMSCGGVLVVTCRSDAVLVRFARAAQDAATEAQARRYAAQHRTD